MQLAAKNEIHGPQKVSFRKRGFIIGSLGERKKAKLLYNRRGPGSGTLLSLTALELIKL